MFGRLRCAAKRQGCCVAGVSHNTAKCGTQLQNSARVDPRGWFTVEALTWTCGVRTYGRTDGTLGEGIDYDSVLGCPCTTCRQHISHCAEATNASHGSKRMRTYPIGRGSAGDRLTSWWWCSLGCSCLRIRHVHVSTVNTSTENV